MLNKVIFIGRLGADPEIRYTPSGQPVATFRIATSERWIDKNGQRQERTEWHRVVVFGKLAEICREHLAKGRQVYVEGRLQTRSYEDRDGIKRSVTEIVAQDIKFLGSKPKAEDEEAPPPSVEPEDEPPADEDLPF